MHDVREELAKAGKLAVEGSKMLTKVNDNDFVGDESCASGEKAWNALSTRTECCGVLIDGDHAVCVDKPRTGSGDRSVSPSLLHRLRQALTLR